VVTYKNKIDDDYGGCLMKKQSRFIAWIMALVICFTNLPVSAAEAVDGDVPAVQSVSVSDVSENDVSENDVSENDVSVELDLPSVSANAEPVLRAASGTANTKINLTIHRVDINTGEKLADDEVIAVNEYGAYKNEDGTTYDLTEYFIEGYMPVYDGYSTGEHDYDFGYGFTRKDYVRNLGGELYLYCSQLYRESVGGASGKTVEMETTVYYMEATTAQHFYVYDGEIVERPDLTTYVCGNATGSELDLEYGVLYNGEGYDCIGLYIRKLSGSEYIDTGRRANYYYLHDENVEIYYIMSSERDISTTQYKTQVYDTFLNPDGSVKEKKLRLEETKFKGVQSYHYSILKELDMRYYFLKSESHYSGTPMRDVVVEFIYQERNDYGCQIVVTHVDKDTGEEISEKTVLDVSGDVSVNDLITVSSADVEPYKFVDFRDFYTERMPRETEDTEDTEDIEKTDEEKEKEEEAKREEEKLYYQYWAALEDYLDGYEWVDVNKHILDVSIIYPGVHKVNITYRYKYVPKVHISVQKEDVSGNAIGEPETYVISEEEGETFVDIPVEMEGHRLLFTREDADCKGVTFSNVVQAEVPCVRISCADLARGTYNANLTLVYEQYSPSTTVTLQQKDTLGNTIKEDLTYVLSEQGQTVDIPVNIDGYRLESIKQDMDYQGISFTTYVQEGKSYIRIACTELELGTYKAGVTLVYQPVDSITFYQVLGDKVATKKMIKTIECGDLSGTYVLSDYAHSSLFDGYVFKGYASYKTEEELQLAIKEDSVAYIEEIVHTDDDAREHTNVYLIYKKVEAPADKEGLWIEEIAPQYYTGKAIKPEIRVYDGTTLLLEKIDYTVSYKNNTNVSGGSKLPTVTVKGKGNYSGTEKATFEILPVSLSSKDVSYVSVCSVFNNKAQKPVPVITHKGKKLKKNKDFTILYPSKADGACKEPGEYVLRVVGEGNYTGTVEVPFVIVPKEKGKTPVSKLKIGAIDNQIYTGSAIKPVVSVKKGKKDLVVGKDYTVSYWNNIEVGTGYVCVAGMGSYVGNVTIPFRIGYISVADASVSVIEDCVYNGDAQEPAFSVTLKGKTLVPNEDYVFQYKNNIDAGIARIEIEGINHYEGTLTQTFKIRGIEIQKSWVAEEDKIVVPYEKGGSKPKITMTFDGEDLVCGRDYSLTYLYSEGTGDGEDVAGGTNDGDDYSYPRIVVTGQGDYDGEFELPFTMTKRSLSDKNIPVTIKVGNVAYNKKAGKWMSTPVLVDANGLYLEPGVDYEETFRYVTDSGQELTAKDAPAAGTKIKVIVTGKGYYTGTITGTYTVTKGSIAKAKGKIAAQEYTGSAITLDSDDFSLKIGKTELVYGKDFEVVEGSYQKNIAKGTASVKIRGLGEYGGEKTLKFKITGKKFIWFWNLF